MTHGATSSHPGIAATRFGRGCAEPGWTLEGRTSEEDYEALSVANHEQCGLASQPDAKKNPVPGGLKAAKGSERREARGKKLGEINALVTEAAQGKVTMPFWR